MVLSRPLTLDAEALARLVRLENLGELHVTLKPLGVWRPRAEEVRVETETRARLLREGLLDRRGRLDVEVAASLAVLCRAGAEFYGWINEGERTRAVLAAAIGREAVLAIREDDEVTIAQIRPESLPQVLVAQIPDVPPARGEAHNIMRSEAVAAVGGRHRTEAGVGSRPAPREVRAVQQIAALPTTGGGELYVAVRDRASRRRPVANPLRYADTSMGRWLNLMSDAGGGEQRVLVAPATKADLIRRLQEMHRSLAG
ncbi:MAG TPA: ESX secretion-associated protein EspG [Actinophytocola sp.]|uniref:ESX secretion-associated protein EspG n=1 Tax=Actinophytocola sp. TaxID=1872138 RepID=UPI002F9235DE